jgi:hypothetical protein
VVVGVDGFVLGTDDGFCHRRAFIRAFRGEKKNRNIFD